MWVLFVTIINVGVFSNSFSNEKLEFSSLQSCQIAAKQIEEKYKVSFTSYAKTNCLKK